MQTHSPATSATALLATTVPATVTPEEIAQARMIAAPFAQKSDIVLAGIKLAGGDIDDLDDAMKPELEAALNEAGAGFHVRVMAYIISGLCGWAMRENGRYIEMVYFAQSQHHEMREQALNDYVKSPVTEPGHYHESTHAFCYLDTACVDNPEQN